MTTGNEPGWEIVRRGSTCWSVFIVGPGVPGGSRFPAIACPVALETTARMAPRTRCRHRDLRIPSPPCTSPLAWSPTRWKVKPLCHDCRDPELTELTMESGKAPRGANLDHGTTCPQPR